MTQQTSRLGRRSVLAAIGGLVGCSVFQHATADPIRSQQTVDDDWTQSGADAANTARLTDGVGPTGDITKAWDAYAGYHTDGVAIIDETVYFDDGGLTAVNVADGTERWAYSPAIPDLDYPEDVVADVEYPAVMAGTVYATVRFGVFDGDNNYTSALIALDAETGKKRWRVDAHGLPGRGFSPVTAIDGTVFTTGPSIDSNGSSGMYAFDGYDGSVRWKRLGEHTPGAVADGRLYLAGEMGVKALDTATGETIWTALPRVAASDTPVVSDGTVFVTEEGTPGVTLIALDATTGAEHWRTAYPSSADYPSLSVETADTDTVYIDVGSADADVIALDRADGSERWRASIPQPEGHQESVPTNGMARVGNFLYVGGAVLDPTDGTIRWTGTLSTPWIAPRPLIAVAGGRSYFGGQDMTVLS